jgi:hypothetical protein
VIIAQTADRASQALGRAGPAQVSYVMTNAREIRVQLIDDGGRPIEDSAASRRLCSSSTKRVISSRGQGADNASFGTYASSLSSLAGIACRAVAMASTLTALSRFRHGACSHPSGVSTTEWSR